MYKNVGRKIKGLAIFIAWIIIAACCFVSFYGLFSSKMQTSDIVIAAAIIIVGSVVALFISWFLYAYGVIAEKAEKTNETAENILALLEEINANRPQHPPIPPHHAPTHHEAPGTENIPLDSFKLPETREELFASQLRKLKKDYEMSRITYDEYEEGKKRLEQKYK